MFILLFTFCQCLVIAGLVAWWLGGCGGVQFFGVFVLLRKPPFYGLQELLLSFYGLAKFRYTLTICAMRSPVVLVVICLSNGLTWRYRAIKKGMAKITIPHHARLKGRILNLILYHARLIGFTHTIL